MTEAEEGRQESPSAERSDPPWAAMGVVVLALVSGAFVTGWHFGRRWGRMMGW
jgi:hypothetical protein